jgi:hypothetical protein
MRRNRWNRDQIIAAISAGISAISICIAINAEIRANQEKERADIQTRIVEKQVQKKEEWIAFLTKQLKETDQQILQQQNNIFDDSVRLSFTSPMERERAEADMHADREALALLREKKIIQINQISELRSR